MTSLSQMRLAYRSILIRIRDGLSVQFAKLSYRRELFTMPDGQLQPFYPLCMVFRLMRPLRTLAMIRSPITGCMYRVIVAMSPFLRLLSEWPRELKFENACEKLVRNQVCTLSTRQP